MIILKQVIHDVPTNSVEATWVDQTSPAITAPESVAPDTTDEEGNVIPGVVTPASTTPAVEVQIKCHSYADVQMQMFRGDAAAFGTPLDDYEDMIADVEANIVPFVPPPVVPQRIEALAGLQVLDAAGLASAYTSWATSPYRTFLQRAFIDKAMYWRRDDPTLIAAATDIGLTDLQLDDLFTQAAAL